MRILLLVSSFNGVSQRVWCSLRAAGHVVSVEFAVSAKAMIDAVETFAPDLILCPFLKERVPERIWRTWRTIVLHPGPVGDRGPSALDHAIMDGAPVWGVTALQATADMDAGPVWACETFRMPPGPVSKTALYGGPVADAVMACVEAVVDRAADPEFTPTPLPLTPRPVSGTGLRPLMRQDDRAFSWQQPAEDIVRRISAADGAPGVRATIAGLAVYAYDALPDFSGRSGRPGAILGQAEGAVLIATGHSRSGAGGVWLGHLRAVGGVKLPATRTLRGLVRHAPHLRSTPEPWLTYVRQGPVGTLTFVPYNGALSTRQCRRLAAALRHAMRQDTRVLVLRGSFQVFCNGIHLGVIESAEDPAAEAWANIRAINAVCRHLCSRSRQLVISAVTGNAGAGGAMLPLGADLVLARTGVVLNPHYDMGVHGSELHTFTLPRRVGDVGARRLLEERLPVDAEQAQAMGLVDAVGPRDPDEFVAWLAETAERTGVDGLPGEARRRADLVREPLSYYETIELAEMARDIFDDRHGFAGRRKAFVYKERPAATPPRLAIHRAGADTVHTRRRSDRTVIALSGRLAGWARQAAPERRAVSLLRRQ